MDTAQFDAASDSLRNALRVVPAVDLAIVFGSVASGKARADSDLDIALDLGHPITADEKMALDALAREGIITQQLAAAMRKAVGFRNIAIHNDEAIDWEFVHAIATQHLNDFEQFATAVWKITAE